MLHLVIASLAVALPTDSADTKAVASYRLDITPEMRSSMQLLGQEALPAKFVLLEDGTFNYILGFGDRAKIRNGTYVKAADTLQFAFTDNLDSVTAISKQGSLTIGAFTFSLISNDISGQWVLESNGLQDRANRYHFGRDGKWKCVCGEYWSTGSWELRDNAILLSYEVVDGNRVDGYPIKPLKWEPEEGVIRVDNKFKFVRLIEQKAPTP